MNHAVPISKTMPLRYKFDTAYTLAQNNYHYALIVDTRYQQSKHNETVDDDQAFMY